MKDIIYEPREDSYLLQKYVEEYSKGSVLDMGTGSGIQSKNLINLKIPKNNITAVDINPTALKQAEKLGIKTIKSNLFKNIKEKYNFIFFKNKYFKNNCNSII